MKAEYTLDFRGSITPIMLLKVTQTFSKMETDDILEIQGSDPDTQKDLFKVLPDAAYDLISVDTSDSKGLEYFYRIRLKKRAKEEGAERKNNGTRTNQIGTC